MADLSKNHMSVVALGSQNPQILNVDFLRDNEIVPVNEAPFDELFKQEKPFSKFISTPPFTNLALGPIEFIVDEQRFQLREYPITEWAEARIIRIMQNYFGVLKYTPLTMIGINLNSTISFASTEETETFQELFLPKASKVLEFLPKDRIDASMVLRWPYNKSDSRIALTIERTDVSKNKRMINFNYEFDFTDWKSFGEELNKMPEISIYSDSIIKQLLGAI